MANRIFKVGYILKGTGLSAVMLAFALFFTIQQTRAQNKPALEYQVKAAFLYNFTRFISWPASAFNSPKAPFIIGIVGNDPFGSYLEDIIDQEKVDDHPIIVQRYHDIRDINNCQILYISAGDNNKIKEIIAGVAHKNVLTVSDADKFVNWGGIINFFKDDNKLRVQINTAAAKAAGVEISSKLLKISKIH
ncbi:YfiR family protein [Mucilaginibacter sp. UYCu711]|uniref:YfiR family protein n=1 Tax=Mucilaginibacter sp. UYCu711 TaxID=3156339 RepID=UPI003D2059A6